MKLNIIIVNYRSWERLDKCLSGIYRQQFSDYTITVVDNFSNDGMTDEFCKLHSKVQFILQDFNGGFAQACNRGAKSSDSSYLLFLNPDTFFSDEILQPLLDTFDVHHDWKIVGIHQRNESGRNMHPFGIFLKWWNVWAPVRSLERMFGGKKHSKIHLSTAPVSFPDWISGSFILIRRSDFEELGGWDERFWMYCEDMDLSKRAAEKNWKRVMYNDLSIIHSHGGSSRINLDIKAKTKLEVIRSKRFYINKHFSGIRQKIALFTLLFTTYMELLLLWPFSATKRKMLQLSFTQ